MVGYDGALGLATLYRAIYGIAASYIIARLAPDRPMQHAPWWAGFLGPCRGALWVPRLLGTKDRAFGLMYPLRSIVLAMPQAWVGGPTLRRAVEGTSPKHDGQN